MELDLRCACCHVVQGETRRRVSPHDYLSTF